MRLPWRRPNKTRAVEEARKARERAEWNLAQIHAETPRYRELAVRLREIRERNHLREAFEATFRGGSAS